jgi:cellulose synthase operon protein C
MKRLSLVVGLSAALAAPAFACGPDFPLELIPNRARMLEELPSSSFALTAATLLGAPKTDFKPVESWDAQIGWQEGLSETEIDAIEKIRDEATGADERAALIAALPEDLRDYERAAALFKNDLAAATRALIDYNERHDATTRRGLFARYTLARAAYLQEDFAGAETLSIAVRDAVASGAPDPAGLAVASFGEQARLHRFDDPKKALTLYAEQAARGSESGLASLRELALEMFAAEDLNESLKDPLKRKLLVGFALARAVDLAQTDADPYDEDGGARYYRETRQAPPILKLLDALESGAVENVEQADQLAAIAYRAGRFEQAARFAERAKSAPLSLWVQAKLAQRGGNEAAAQAAYLAADESWGSRMDSVSGGYEELKPGCRVRGEAALLKLDRAEYVAAFEVLWPAAATYWTDVARLAERVLTLDELKSFVDRQVPLAAPVPPRAADQEFYFFDPAARPDLALRQLLARRLSRAGRDADALVYFDDPWLKTPATARTDALKQADRERGIDHAEALFAAAQLERTRGIDLLGFELAPDSALYGGAYPLGSYAELSAALNDVVGLPPPTLADWIKREAANAPTHDQRYHYRRIASERAVAAADVLPTWSQAYAATLCFATRWQIDDDPGYAESVYRRYLNTGPFVVWGEAFGRDCPAPDFTKARADQSTRDRAALIANLKRWAPLGVAIGVITLGLLVMRVVRRRRVAR